MRVDVVYSPAARETDLSEVELPPGSTVEQAIAASGVLQRHARLAAQPLLAGVWGQRCSLQAPLQDGDRVELYRPLQVDPKDARRTRSRQSVSRRSGVV